MHEHVNHEFAARSVSRVKQLKVDDPDARDTVTSQAIVRRR